MGLGKRKNRGQLYGGGGGRDSFENLAEGRAEGRIIEREFSFKREQKEEEYNSPLQTTLW